jgi:hypothetical protein
VEPVGFLHTAETHVDTFRRLLADVAPGRPGEHLVRPDLLDLARRVGPQHALVCAGLREDLAGLRDRGAGAILCTCSTVGAAAEDLGRELGIRVVRADRPMAEAAVRAGRRIALVAALESTLRPSRALLEDAAVAAGRQVEIVDAPCLDAWMLFEGGDLVAFHRHVAAHIESLDQAADVVVLAQASMAPAADLVRSPRTVLTSPRLAVEALCGM